MDALIVADSSIVRRELHDAGDPDFSSEKLSGKSLPWVTVQTGSKELLPSAGSYLLLIRWVVGTCRDTVMKVGDEM